MSVVVLRCPNCGTTRATPGECEACHEAQVRYYCTNHTPGRWLETWTCPHCGASFRDPARTPVAPQNAPAAPARTSPDSSISRRTPAPVRPSVRRPTTAGDTVGRRERSPPAGDDESDPRETSAGRGTRVPSWQEILLATARGRRRPLEAAPEMEVVPAGRGLGGCFMRFVLLMLFLFFALVSGTFVFGNALLRMFLPF